MPVSLVALKTLRYAGQSYTAGDAFEARDAADATVLKLTKLARDTTSDTAPVISVDSALSEVGPTEYAPVAADAIVAHNPDAGVEFTFSGLGSAEAEFDQVIPPTDEGSPVPEASDEEPAQPRKRRTYRRRDMTPEV